MITCNAGNVADVLKRPTADGVCMSLGVHRIQSVPQYSRDMHMITCNAGNVHAYVVWALGDVKLLVRVKLHGYLQQADACRSVLSFDHELLQRNSQSLEKENMGYMLCSVHIVLPNG